MAESSVPKQYFSPVTEITFLWQELPSCDRNLLLCQENPSCDLNFLPVKWIALLSQEYPFCDMNFHIKYYKFVGFPTTISSISFFALPFHENCDISAQIIGQISCEILHISSGEFPCSLGENNTPAFSPIMNNECVCELVPDFLWEPQKMNPNIASQHSLYV